MIEIITDVGTLLRKAKAVGEAKKSGDKEALRIAEEDLKGYKELVLMSDKLSLTIQ